MTTLTRSDVKGQLSKDEVLEQAEQAYRVLRGKRPWDRRRILQAMEKLHETERREPRC